MIGTPGVLLDSSLNQITGVQISQDGVDVAPAGVTTVSPLPNNTFPTTAYTFAGTAPASQINFSQTVLTGSNVVPALNQYCCTPGTNTQSLSISDNQPFLYWSNAQGYPLGATRATDPIMSGGGFNGSSQVEYVVFPTATNANSYMFGLSETIATIPATSPSPTMAAAPGSSRRIQRSPPRTQRSRGRPTCWSPGIERYDARDVSAHSDGRAGRSALLSFYIGQSNLTIQNKARTH